MEENHEGAGYAAGDGAVVVGVMVRWWCADVLSTVDSTSWPINAAAAGTVTPTGGG